jgi:two-component system NarL family sensor kinase
MSLMAASGATRARLSLLAGAVVTVEVIAAVALTLVVGWSWHQALDAYVVTNALMGFTFGGCGTVLALARPANAVGWLFVADGLGHATASLAAPLGQRLHDIDAPLAVQRGVLTVVQWSWPWSVGLFLPLALLLFPDGRLPSPAWRPWLIAVCVTAPLFVVEVGTAPDSIAKGLPHGYLTFHGHDSLAPLWIVAELRTSGALLLALVALVMRYRRADEVQRRQLLWLLLAAVTLLAGVIPWSFVAGTPIAVLFAIPLIPVAVAVAIIRHQLLDIRVVVSRALTWLLLTAAAIGGYALLVLVLDRFIAANVGRSTVATVVIAVVIAPLLPRLQRAVDRLMFGDRGDPARVASRVSQGLQAGIDGDLAAAASAIRLALRLPYAAVRADGVQLGADGDSDGRVEAIPLEYAGSPVGELVVGLRRGERALAARDLDVLTLVATPLAVAVHATRLSEDLQVSRERLVRAREEERRRIRRDLHDGLGPTLTGLSLTADAAANLVARDPDRASDLLAGLRTDARTAIADVRALVDDLRPAALDQVGLLEALRQRIDQLTTRGNGLRIALDAQDPLPHLPAATEVALYRIATEALTNVVRHAGASSAMVRLVCDATVELDIVDDGPRGGPWRPGVGMRTICERAAELGGTATVGPTSTGGLVHVSLPLR